MTPRLVLAMVETTLIGLVTLGVGLTPDSTADTAPDDPSKKPLKMAPRQISVRLYNMN